MDSEYLLTVGSVGLLSISRQIETDYFRSGWRRTTSNRAFLAVINDWDAGLFRRSIRVLLNVGLVARNIQATLFFIIIDQQEFIPTHSEYLGGWKISTDRFPFCFGSLDLRPLVEERK